ncbi:M23 family metallopeptidase [Cardinium endosymbiont of Tipula unca]|uniref:M23 family metallopeptidase n=1 Tax=Cardinium endosymbiont of Tipula unca TaxID=3066216 RepID=UPI0030D301F9
MRIYRKFINSFEGRYQLIVRNVENFAEYVTAPFSYATIVTLVCFWFCASFGLGLFLAKTVLSKWMNPTYIEMENKKKILFLATTVEELEQQIESQTKFIETLQNVIQGKSKQSATSTMHTIPPAANTHEPIKDETISASQTLAPKRTLVTNQVAPLQYPGLFFSPIKGMITAPFNRKTGHYGVDIVAKEKEPIKAMATGIVIFADWSVETGWVIAIQHHNNLVSICKHCAILFKKVGNLVRAGDIVALMGNSGEISTGPHLHFELWNEGVALNPEDFINF